MSERIFVHEYTAVCALGNGNAEITKNLRDGIGPGMRLSGKWRKNGAQAFLGHVDAGLSPVPIGRHDTRNNRILQLCLDQLKKPIRDMLNRVGADRFAIVAGTSTSGISEAENALLDSPPGGIRGDYDYASQEFGSPAAFAAELIGARGPCFTLSTACTSSTNAFLSARRLLRGGLADAVLVIGADSLCRTTVEGFISLEAVAEGRCEPMSRNRQGINIGEGSAVFLLSRLPARLELLGAGESCDAFHLSSPEPEGKGAEAAMRHALTDARLRPADIGYVNLHATGTAKNDAMESLAMSRVFPSGVPCSGTKPLTGHTLGAAGAIEAAICCLAMEADFFPRHVWDGQPDPQLPALRLAQSAERFPAGDHRRCMTNNFAFGGSNVSLIFGFTP
jgi:3-oxoacyl-[acyl-carrier-protein] synthase-1